MAAVLVHIDLDGDKPHTSSITALMAGRQVASSWGATLYAALIVHDETGGAGPDSTAQAIGASSIPGMDSIEQQLSRAGADKLVVGLTDTPVAPLWALVGNAWQDIVDHLRPRLVLFGAGAPSAPELAPRTGARIGARLLTRARTTGGDEVEMRDRDGAYVRIGDSGAAVALVGRCEKPVRAPAHDNDIDVVVLAVPGGADNSIELVTSQPAEVAHTSSALVVLGDDVTSDPKVVAEVVRLAKLLGAPFVGGAAAASVVGAGAVIEARTPLAPDLCVAVGNTNLDVAGATSLVKIAAPPDKTVDGALPSMKGLTELIAILEIM